MKTKNVKKLLGAQMLDAHPLAQIFMVNAIMAEAERISKTSAADYPARGFIDGEAWIDCAKTLNKLLKDFY